MSCKTLTHLLLLLFKYEKCSRLLWTSLEGLSDLSWIIIWLRPPDRESSFSHSVYPASRLLQVSATRWDELSISRSSLGVLQPSKTILFFFCSAMLFARRGFEGIVLLSLTTTRAREWERASWSVRKLAKSDFVIPIQCSESASLDFKLGLKWP